MLKFNSSIYPAYLFQNMEVVNVDAGPGNLKNNSFECIWHSPNILKEGNHYDGNLQINRWQP